MENHSVAIGLLDFFRNHVFWNSRAGPRGKYFVFVKQQSDMSTIIKHFWKYDIRDLTILHWDLIYDRWVTFSSSPFKTSNKCGQEVHLDYLGPCENISYSLLKIEKTLPNLKHCTFTASLVNVLFELPYIGSPKDKEPGLYIRPLQLIAQSLNLNITYENVDPTVQIEYLKNGLKVRHLIFNAVKDVLVSCANRYIYFHDQFDLSDIFFYDNHYWVISKPEKLSSVKILMSVFNLDLWIACITMYVLISLVFCIIIKWKPIEKLKSGTICFIYVFLITLGAGINSMPSSSSLRILIMAYFLYSIHIGYYYQGKLGSILTKPGFQKGITSVEEMSFAQDIVPMTYIGIRDSFLLMDYPAAKHLYNRSQFILEAVLSNLFKKMLLHKNISLTAYCSEIPSNFRQKMNVLGSDYLLNMEATYGFRKGHPFRTYFNVIINRLLEAGFQQKWLSDITDSNTFEDSEGDRVVISLEHLQAAFFSLFIGYVVAMGIFFVEWMLYFIKNITILNFCFQTFM